MGAQPAEAYRGDVEQAVTDIRAALAAGRTVVTLHQGAGPAQRMVEVLGEHDVPAALVADQAFEGTRATASSRSARAA